MRYRLASPLIHDGVAFEPGDVTDSGLFTAEQQAHLVSCGTLLPEAENDPGGAGAGDDPENPDPAPTRPRGRKGNA